MATLIRVRDRIVNLDQMVSADMDEEHRVILYMTPVEGEGTAVGKEQVAVVFHGDEAACVRWALEGAADDTWGRWQRHQAQVEYAVAGGEVMREAIPDSSGMVNVGKLPLSILGLSPRAWNALVRGGVETMAHLLALSDWDVMSIRNFGRVSLEEVEERLAVFGLKLREEPRVALEEAE